MNKIVLGTLIVVVLAALATAGMGVNPYDPETTNPGQPYTT